jgi:hypothetical protein
MQHVRLVRNCEFGCGGRCRGTLIGHQIGEAHI